MQTYNPNNNQGNQTDNYRNQDYNNTGNYYGDGTNSYHNTNYYGDGTGGYSNANYDENYYYGNQAQYQNSFGNQTIASQEVVTKSFLFMVVALVITAVASLTTSPVLAYKMLTGSGFIVLLFAELAIAMVSNWAISKNYAVVAGVLFAAYSYLTGVLCSILFVVFTTASITIIFLATAAVFGIMAVYGLVTKRDLTNVGSILMMALISIVIVSFVNLFLIRSSMLDTVICAIGVLVFVGLTAYDAQKIKHLALLSNDSNVLTLALYGAFELYLDFINLFLKLIRLFGKRKS